MNGQSLAPELESSVSPLSTDEAIIAPARTGRPLTPAARRRNSQQEEIDEGVTLADGNVWVLARIGLAPRLAEVRDRMYNESVMYREVRMADVLRVAWVALLTHYDLSDGELIALLSGLSTEQEAALVQATSTALFGSAQPNRTYTDWALASFYANGIDPAKVPPQFVPDVLSILLQTGRTVAQKEWIGAAIAAEVRSDLLSMITPKPTA